jgi:dCTP deaminase
MTAEIHKLSLTGEGSAEKPDRRASAQAGNGIQPSQFLREFVSANVIMASEPVGADQIQPASIDLRLDRFAYRVRASFLPGPAKVMDRIKAMDGLEIDLNGGAVLETGKVYVIPLQELLALPQAVRGYANPKSSTGRLDVLTRLITEHAEVFDEVPPGYRGRLYVEVAPQTFSVVVRPGTRLNQLRLQRGVSGIALGNGNLRRRYRDGELVQPYDAKAPLPDNLVPVTIDLKGEGPGSVIGYRAKRFTDRIDLSLIRHYDLEDYWEPLLYRKEPSLTLDPGEFYILATREAVSVPPDLSAEMVAYEARSGEYRVHYAGFFDPGFGYGTAGAGSKAVLEVRSHQIPFMLEHGQPIGWLRYEKMADTPAQVYGQGIGSNYQRQGLALAKQFKPPS